MSTIAKVFVVVVFALSIAFAVSSALLMTQQETWRDNYEKLERKSQQESQEKDANIKKLDQGLAETKAALGKANADVEQLTQAKQDLEKEKSELKTSVADKEKGLNELRTSFTAIQAGIAQWSQRNEKLQKDLADAQAALKKTEEDLRTAKAEKDKAVVERDEMTKKLADLEGRKKEIEDRLARASDALEKLQKSNLVNVEEVLAGAQKPIDGRVLEVDTDQKVIIINVGKSEGVGLGYSFTVYRDGEYVGEIKVDQLKDDLAGASPVAGTMKSDIRKGDNVTTRIR